MDADREIQITEGPKTIYNATIHDEVFFSCKVEGTEESPSWNINGKDYFSTDLPPIYVFSQGALKVMITTFKLNGSVLFCFYDLFPCEVIKSQSASLFIIITDKGWYSPIYIVSVTSKIIIRCHVM